MNDLFLIGVAADLGAGLWRERIAVPTAELQETLWYLRHLARLEEVAVLSTESRVEVLAVSYEPRTAMAEIRGWLINRAGGKAGIYERFGRDALRHLCRVVRGSDPRSGAETDVLGQARRAYYSSLDEGLAGGTLNEAFSEAFRWARTPSALGGSLAAS